MLDAFKTNTIKNHSCLRPVENTYVIIESYGVSKHCIRKNAFWSVRRQTKNILL